MRRQSEPATALYMQDSTVQTRVALPSLSHSKKRFSRYGPLLLWAVLIFLGSTSILSASNTSVILKFVLWIFPAQTAATFATIHFLIRKAGHVTEYAILALLAARAFISSSHDLLRRKWFWFALALVVIYALGDEFHQSFVPSRTASIYDSMIDAGGGLTALGLMSAGKVLRTFRGAN